MFNGNIIRRKAAEDALIAMLHWLMEEEAHLCQISSYGEAFTRSSPMPVKIAIYDATNTTIERRAWLVDRILASGIPYNEVKIHIWY